MTILLLQILKALVSKMFNVSQNWKKLLLSTALLSSNDIIKNFCSPPGSSEIKSNRITRVVQLSKDIIRQNLFGLL